LFRQRNLLGWLWLWFYYLRRLWLRHRFRLYYLRRLWLGLWDMRDLNVFNGWGYAKRFGLQLSVPDELHSY
jgi:hypothetical protein